MCVFIITVRNPHSTATPTATTHGQGGCIDNSKPLLGGGLVPERARLENNLFYLIDFQSASRNDII